MARFVGDCFGGAFFEGGLLIGVFFGGYLFAVRRVVPLGGVSFFSALRTRASAGVGFGASVGASAGASAIISSSNSLPPGSVGSSGFVKVTFVGGKSVSFEGTLILVAISYAENSPLILISALCQPELSFQDRTTRLNLLLKGGEEQEVGGGTRYVCSYRASECWGVDYEL